MSGGIKSEDFDGTTDDQELLAVRSTLGGYFQDHLVPQHLVGLDQHHNSSVEADAYLEAHQTTSSGPTLMHVGGLFGTAPAPRRQRSLNDQSSCFLVTFANLGHADGSGRGQCTRLLRIY
ncbi:hypothetical protein Ciccas_010894 [Cichlidogyrus casuarinus]|uniref:Uncharacterized protein n=1 Tax=Cichlidogyrus casuarinus TaxID=1844966 RepID=A0ABD2PTE8_9PLAT